MVLATHDGDFHSDDAGAYALLGILYSQPHELLRTRNAEELVRADIRFDVGGKYDPATGDFDHHFPGSPVREAGMFSVDKGARYSSIGLIWKDLGPQILEKMLGKEMMVRQEMRQLWGVVDEALIAPIDSVDTGTGSLMQRATGHEMMKPVLAHNRTWQESHGRGSRKRENDFFVRAADIFAAGFTHAVNHAARGLLQGVDMNLRQEQIGLFEGMQREFEQVVKLGSADRIEVHEQAKQAARETLTSEMGKRPHPNVLLLRRMNLPWQEVLSAGKLSDIAYVVEPVYQGKWYVRAVPENRQERTYKLLLPKEWRNKEKATLATQIGRQELVRERENFFCHPQGFVAGAAKMEHALLMAIMAYEMEAKSLGPEHAKLPDLTEWRKRDDATTNLPAQRSRPEDAAHLSRLTQGIERRSGSHRPHGQKILGN